MDERKNRQLNCNIVIDLLPNYIDHVTSADTNQEIEAHLKECETCRAEYNNMIQSLEADEQDRFMETKMVKDGLVKTRRVYMIKGILLAALFLALLVPGIVNYAINKRFTWHYIVIASLALVSIVAAVAILKRNNKIVYTMGTATVLIPVYLYIIESVINKYFIPKPASWFMTKAFPTYLVWAAIIWITFLLVRFSKIPNGYCIAIGFGLALIGSILTNAIFVKGSIKEIVKSSWISLLVCCFCVIVSVLIGYYQSMKK